MSIKPDGSYNRFDANKRYTDVIFYPSRGLQSPELNEVQSYMKYAMENVGNALFKDGDVIKGCVCVVNHETGSTTVEPGKLYLKGMVRDIAGGSFTIPTEGSVKIGVYFQEVIVTSFEDPDLRDPCVGTRNYQEIGAARLQYQLSWNWQIEGVTEPEAGEFYTIYTVENGVLIQKSAAPQLDSMNVALARYDNESNGSYVVRGMNVTCLNDTGLHQTFAVGEGKAHVNGYEVELAYALRVAYDNESDLQLVNSDPYIFEGDAYGDMVVNLNYTPLKELLQVNITAQNTTTLTHGSYNGALDPIPSTSVLEIVSITQGATTYVRGVDYRLTAGQVDWSLEGAEPAPGSTYTIIYRYMTNVLPTEVTDTSFKIHGAVDGTMVLVTYTWKMPRYDLITIDNEGIVRRIKGLAQPWNPIPPKAPTGQLVLAEVLQTWKTNGKPKVNNNAIRVVSMSDIETMRNMISDLYYLISQEQLKNNANASDPTAKKGIFVDPFFDDDMRDQGVEQTGAIVSGHLILPIATTVHDFGKDSQVYTLPYDLEPVISQEMRTGSMKINPYNAFDPIPADVEVTLNIDRWTEIETQWLSPVTSYYGVSGWSGTYYSDQVVSSAKRNIEYMRQLTQKFTIDGLKANETITSMKFDGVEVTPAPLP